MIHAYIFTMGIQETSSHGEEFLRIMHQINQRARISITVSMFQMSLTNCK